MAFEFQYHGGVKKPTPHTVEKFLLFFVIAGKEIPAYQMQRDSLLFQKADVDPFTFVTGNNIAKLFIGQQGFGIARKYHSFYMKLLSGPRPEVTIKPFSLDTFFFTGKVSFLKKSQVIGLLDKGSESTKFLENQMVLPLDLLRKIVTVDKTDLKKDVRHVRIGHQEGESSVPPWAV